MKKRLVMALMAFLFLYPQEPGFAYDNIRTHPELTKVALENSNLNEYLRNNMGIAKGKDNTYNGKMIVELLQDGSNNEDIPFRAYNHFWNPIHNEGLDDEGWGPVHFTGLGNRHWAMGYGQDGASLDDCGPGDHSSNRNCNDYSWRRARDTYCEALISQTEGARNGNMAIFWEKLGRVLHLLEDVSVPAHTRNDMFGHLDFTTFEGVNPLGWGGNLYEFWVKVHPWSVPTYSQNILKPLFLKPEHYWDGEVYNGADPDVTIPIDEGEQSGIAEYTNANFLSKCAMFTEDLPLGDTHYFPYPKRSSVIDPATNQMPPEETTAEDGNVDRVFYVRKDRDGEDIEHFAQAKYVWAGLYLTLTDIGRYYRLAYQLDDTVHEAYAKKLIPKAVGYTAGLIDFFFRGTMEITPPDQFVYALVDITETDPPLEVQKIFTDIKLKLKNTTPNDEEMVGGSLIAVASYYKPISEDFDPSQQAPLWEDIENEYSYSVSAENTTSPPSRDDFTEYSFDFTEDPIPTNVSDLTIQVIYRGVLGAEEDAVAVSMIDIYEPDHINIWNNTDYFCNDGTLMRSNFDNDLDGDGFADAYCSPTQATVQVTFSETPLPPGVPQTDYDIDIGVIEPGEFKKVVVLQDQEEYYFSATYYWIDPDPEDGFPIPWDYSVYIGEDDIAFAFNGVKNQDHIHLEPPPQPEYTLDALGVNFIMEVQDRYVFQPDSIFRDQLTQHTIPGFIFRVGTEECDNADWSTEDNLP